MNRWQALVEIVRSFNERDRPGYALLALAIVLLAATVVTAFVSLGVGALGVRETLRMLGGS